MTVRRSSTKPLLFIRPIRFNPFNRFTSRYGLRRAIAIHCMTVFRGPPLGQAITIGENDLDG
jgi:hypothetical protein